MSLDDFTQFSVNNKPGNPAHTDSIITDVRSEQIRIIFSATPASLVAIFINSIVLSLVLWDVISHISITAWFLSTNALSLFRWYLFQQFKKQNNNRYIEEYWHRLAVFTTALSGASWGAASIWLFSEQNIAHQVFLTFVIGGMCAGGATSLSAILVAGRSFVLLASCPIIIQFLLLDSNISTAMAFMSVMFMTMILLSVNRLNTTILDNINNSITQRHQRKLAEKTIRYQAFHDDLTKLPNRKSILVNLDQALKLALQTGNTGAVLFIGLDGFKRTNSSLGHNVGDELLIQVAKRLSSQLKPHDIVARNNGDEFIVMLSNLDLKAIQAETLVMDVADNFRQIFEAPFVVLEHRIASSVCIGISLFSKSTGNAEELLECAKVAMNHAKKDGHDNIRLFSKSLRDEVNQRQVVEIELRSALDKNELELYFQPQFDSSEKLIGAESLLRWNHPEKGMVPPGLFIETAEQTGLIIPIGNWVLRTACEHLKQLEKYPDLTVSVNVSAHQFRGEQFIGQAKQILKETTVDPNRLKLEITETMMINDIDQTIDSMNQLRELGIRFSVDDFGTGYSSLAYLNRLPINELKIDQAFVHGIDKSTETAAIVIAIINMAKHLKLDIIAEGVETVEELEFLKKVNCHRYQGYYFAYPQPFEKFLNFIEKNNSPI